MTINQGFIYIVTGASYAREAIHSIESLSRCTPKTGITVVTDQPELFASTNVHVVRKQKTSPQASWKSNLAYKVQGLLQTPYQKTVFLDSDTHVCASIDELFFALQFFDLLAMPSYIDCQQPYIDETPRTGLVEINTGVIGYNSTPAVKAFLENWLRCYMANYRKYKHDQPAFVEALAKSDIRFFPISNAYNFRINYLSRSPRTPVKVLHGRGVDFSYIDSRLNKSVKDRVWVPARNRLLYDQRALTSVTTYLRALLNSCTLRSAIRELLQALRSRRT